MYIGIYVYMYISYLFIKHPRNYVYLSINLVCFFIALETYQLLDNTFPYMSGDIYIIYLIRSIWLYVNNFI